MLQGQGMGCALSTEKIQSDVVFDAHARTISKSCFLFCNMIGEGGFGKVYSAMMVHSRDWFAVKEINKFELMKHKTGVDMLVNELKAMQRLDHPFVIRLSFAFQDTQSCFLALDLKTGGDLRHYLRNRTIFDEDDVAFYLACIGSALHHIHIRKIVHRDVKPENIILDSQGFPHLTDFGVAHVAHDSSASLTTTLASGTKQYLAPEVFTKLHVHGAEVDYWSLGVLAYELLFGRRPFDKHCPTAFIQYLENAFLMMQKRQVRADRSQRTCGMFSSPSPPTCGFDSDGLSSPMKRSFGSTASPSPVRSSSRESHSNGFPVYSPGKSSSLVDCNQSPNASIGKAVSDKYSTHEHSKFYVKAMDLVAGSEGSTCKFSGTGGTSDAEYSSRDDASVYRVTNVGSCPSIGSSGVHSLHSPSPVKFGRSVASSPLQSILGNTSSDSDAQGDFQPFPEEKRYSSCCADGSEGSSQEQLANAVGLFEDHWAVTFGDLPPQLRVHMPTGVSWLGEISAPCIKMLEGLFEVRPGLRLGCRNITAFQQHDFFKCRGYHNVDDLDSRRILPPLVPGRRNSVMGQETELMNLQLVLNGCCAPTDGWSNDGNTITAQEQLKFKDFFFVSKRYSEDWNATCSDSSNSNSQLPVMDNSAQRTEEGSENGKLRKDLEVLFSKRRDGRSNLHQEGRPSVSSSSSRASAKAKLAEGRPPINHNRIYKFPPI